MTLTKLDWLILNTSVFFYYTGYSPYPSNLVKVMLALSSAILFPDIRGYDKIP